jgi:hypothetical protein
VTTSGPATAPLLTSWWKPTSAKNDTPALLIVVTPDSSARRNDSKSAACVCASTRPGRTYFPFRSIVRRPDAAADPDPIASIRPLRNVSEAFGVMRPSRRFTRLALTIAIASGTRDAGGWLAPLANPATPNSAAAPMSLCMIRGLSARGL